MNLLLTRITVLLNLIFAVQHGFAQKYIPGETYYDSTKLISYRAGNLPIIISAPHGGSLEPDSVPDRTCSACNLTQDAWTKSISERLYDAIHAQTGCYPHLVINLLHRKKLDTNRNITEAADGNLIAEKAWFAYHQFIDSAKESVSNNYGRGLFLDMHGHAHNIQRIELGYLLSQLDLQVHDSMLNSNLLIEKSSIRGLENHNLRNLSHAQLLKGPKSFGTLLSSKGFPAVPSLPDPFPLTAQPYFNGGYNIQRHGSRDQHSSIDAIQIEMNQSIRFNESTRKILIDSFAKATLEYYRLHYNNEFMKQYCLLITRTQKYSEKKRALTLYPNPASQYLRIENITDLSRVKIYNTYGQKVGSFVISEDKNINISALEAGVYFISILQQKLKFIKY